MDKATTGGRLAALRRILSSKKLDAYIITDSDTAGSEYPAEHFRARSWLTGFDGSNGTCLVSADGAWLWTDGRYHLQAEQQLAGTGIELMREGKTGVPSLEDFLVSRFDSSAAVGVCGETCMVADYDALSEALAPRGIEVSAVPDLAGELWGSDRPKMPNAPVFVLAERLARMQADANNFCGERSDENCVGDISDCINGMRGDATDARDRSDCADGVDDKCDCGDAFRSDAARNIAAVREALTQHGADVLLVCALDSVAWLFGLRGSDVANTPVAYARAIVSQGESILFIDKTKVPDAVLSSLELDGVSLREYGEMMRYLDMLSAGTYITCDPKTVSVEIYDSISGEAGRIEEPDPIGLLKAVKTGAERENIRRCHERDGRVMVRFLMWLEAHAGSVDECEAAEALMDLRSQDPLYLSESFPPICAFGANGAIVHYQPRKDGAAAVRRGGFFVVDGGGQYLDGTTDITRTVWLGTPGPPPAAQRDYTLVLKAHIALASADFRHGVAGAHLDALPRRLLWAEHLDYAHGTGHGVGYVLGVHETPPTITASPNAGYGARVPIEPNMVFSNEPGLYHAGEYGIRIENLVTPYARADNESGTFLSLETLSLCPIDLGATRADLLTTAEKSWLNDYHSEVYRRLAPGLSDAEKTWLAARTRALV